MPSPRAPGNGAGDPGTVVALTQPLIFRKGLDMKEAVAGELAAAYDSAIVDRVRGNDYRFESGRLLVHLAREFGFC